ncbi:MAG: hypothetical protein DGJ47_000464 [Rickettsiaceae bacterium]
MNKKTKDINVALSKLSCQISDFDSEILDLIKAEERGEIYKKFICRFLNYIPVDYRSLSKAEMLKECTLDAYNFFQNKPIKQRKFVIEKSQHQNSDCITIKILENNRPFIIDSLNNLIAKLALQTISTFHPVINCRRNEQGEIVDIFDKSNPDSDESLIYIKVMGSFSEKEIQSLKTKINDLLNLVNKTFDSWNLLLEKMDLMIQDISSSCENKTKPSICQEEAIDFLKWLRGNNFTFLGMINYNTDAEITSQDGAKEIWQNNLAEISTIINFSKSEHYSDKNVMLGKINKVSPIHRNTLLDYILIKQFDQNGNYVKGTIIFGLYGTAIYYQSIKSIPILREKMNYVVDSSGFPVNGYNTKKIKNIIESLPRDILIQVDEKDLYCMCIHMLSSMRSHKLKLFIQQDWSNSFVNFIVFMPREKLTPEAYNEISCYLSDKFGCEIISDNITVVAQDFAHLFATIAIKDQKKLKFSEETMHRDLVNITTNWSDDLLEALSNQFGEHDGSIKYSHIEPSFPADYRHKFTAKNALEDLENIIKSSSSNDLVYNLIRKEGEYYLKIYSPKSSLILSEILPPIENLGFVAIGEQSFAIKESALFGANWLYEFKLSVPGKINISFDILKHNVEEALEKINAGDLTSDPLGKLITLAGFNWLKIKLIKALTCYLHQTEFLYSKDYVYQTLVKHYQYSEMLFKLFQTRFSPQNHSKEEEKYVLSDMEKYLDEVDSSAEDKVLSNIKLIIEAILRTNFYQKSNKQEHKEYLSFKFKSEKVPGLPLPIPYAEIFVYAKDFEGVHLRGGKVARGGLRWSDRGEDYRREVLGLLKAQMTKNTVIVPIGSKGTFYVNFTQDNMSRDDYMTKVVACYKHFLRGLLDLTDNLINNEIVQPKNMVIYDDKNPYLVVAADKGTASFSDYANEISAEYNFWLGDAFASGGSIGYDHKKMGITAKGAWISVQSHFKDKGLDVQNEPFTVTAIGDMSGDVFGNGMLLSKYIKLVAAFNHQHIFIDPEPNYTTTYQERERLFNLPRSSWDDYDRSILSEGGMIYNRSAKSVALTPQIQQLLNTEEDNITPDDLIKLVLKAKVDLIWNGGIGTYIKSSTESHVDIADKSNDSLRINGSELGARVMAEGGNLGISQLGRVEFALNGGAVNTDFIDNSGGVDCSDHEVNIKIALDLAMNNKKITQAERNELLLKMTKEVEDLVLVDNHNQHLAVTIASLSPAFNIESFSQLIRELERKCLLDREVEFLPTKSELARRFAAGEGMTRPELAVLLSYSKMSFDNDLSESKITDDKYFEKYLIEYFPKTMQEQFRDEILNHPLKNEIIRTVITNKLVNHLSGPVISAIQSNTSAPICDIVRAYEVVMQVFNLDQLWQEIIDLGSSVPVQIKIQMFADLIKIIRRGINWFVRNLNAPINISKVIKEYRQQTQELSGQFGSILTGTIKTKFFTKIAHYTNECVSEDLAVSIAKLEVLVSAFDIIFIANKAGSDSKSVAETYFECGENLSIDWLRYACETQVNDSYWNRLSVQALKDDFYDKQRRLVYLISVSNIKKTNINKWIKNNAKYASIFTDFIEEMKMQDTIDLSMIILANKKLEIFVRKLEAKT